MSLDVPAALLERAEAGPVDDAEFLACVRDSLPYAWTVVAQVTEDLRRNGGEFADHTDTPPSDAEWGQIFRAFASDAIQGAMERHFGVKLAFQNCCRVAAFTPAAADSDTYREFISPRAQLLNQSPLLRNC
jgi:hypothetical protein